MNKYIIVSCLIAITLGGVSINLSSTCSCGDYLQPSECTQQCQWNTTSAACQDYPCATYTSTTCPQQSQCYWTGSACKLLTSCSSLSGSNVTACTSQNQWCTNNGGSTCVGNSTCAAFTQATCPTYCNNSTNSCTEFTSCTQRNQTACLTVPNQCNWSNNACSASVCSNLQNSTSSCTFIQTSSTIIPCVLTANGCIDAQIANFTNATICQTNTNGLYHWSTNTTDGSCTACYAIIVQIMFAFMLLLA